MKARLVPCLLLLLAVLLLTSMVACDDTDDYPSPAVIGPEISYAVPPTPLPASARMATEEFLQQKENLDEEWDRIHQEFDQWRTGLTACDGSAVYEAVHDFAVEFNGVTERARGLPRSEHTKVLADTLIGAAEEEEAAYRMLRDRWQPNNLSFFELVEGKRVQTASMQRQVEDKVDELTEEFEDAPTEEEVAEFSEAFAPLKDEWDGLHDDYARVMKQAGQLESGQLEELLTEIADGLQEIGDDVEDLPPLDVIDDEIDALSRAATAEVEALRSLIAASAAMEPASPEKLEADMEKSEALLKQVRDAVKELGDDDPSENLAKLLDFERGYNVLVGKWSDFHGGYNDWRGTEGGCSRTQVLRALDQFSLDFAELALGVRDLPQASHLLSAYTLLMDAVGREEGAIRSLRNSWRPFNVDVFKAVDQERVNAENLRRDAGIALQALSERT